MKIKFAVLSSFIVLLAGCSQAIRPDAYRMTPQVMGFARPDKMLTVLPFRNSSGRRSNVFVGAAADPEVVQTAVQEAVRNSGLFAVIPGTVASQYVLSGDILSQQLPMFGLAMTVTLVVRLTVSDAATGRPLLDRDYRETYTAPVSESWAGSQRLKRAIEGATRLIISDFLRDLNAAV